jgi:hypothetical protein
MVRFAYANCLEIGEFANRYLPQRPNDHGPAHIHIIGQGNSAIFNLNCPAGPLSLRANFGFSDRQLREIQAKLLDHIAELCKAWEEIHGRA